MLKPDLWPALGARLEDRFAELHGGRELLSVLGTGKCHAHAAAPVAAWRDLNLGGAAGWRDATWTSA
jgi:hypothetical protein